VSAAGSDPTQPTPGETSGPRTGVVEGQPLAAYRRETLLPRRSRETFEMASIGHIAVGMAAARLYHPGRRDTPALARSLLAWSALSMLPDLDVIGFRLGVKYADPWGHRGATHSVAFALAACGESLPSSAGRGERICVVDSPLK
jgi:hypothetical protein